LALVTVAPLDEFPPGSVKIVRCSHDDGPLAEGEHDPDRGVVICPRHGSEFDICSGRPLSLPAYQPVETFPVVVEDGVVKVDV
jgi:3-phenylpropionate/trans-cinnamate dioxygenase ferredoxin component